MSLTGIIWKPTNSGDNVEMHGATAGTTWDILCKVFGVSRVHTMTLETEHVAQLDAMHATTGKDESVYSELSKLVIEYGAIEIEAW